MPLCRSLWKGLNSTQDAGPQPAGYCARRNLVGMLFGPAPMSQLQPELLSPSLTPDRELGSQIQFSAWVGDGATLSKVLPSYMLEVCVWDTAKAPWLPVQSRDSAGQNKTASGMDSIPWGRAGSFGRGARRGHQTSPLPIQV